MIITSGKVVKKRNLEEKEFLFSCIMAIWNVEEYLEEAILSIINQTLDFNRYIELILVNDGSPDNSEKICLKYEKLYPDNIIYIKKENGGVSSARNLGMQYATGIYFNFIDSDDKFSFNTLNAVNNFFNENYFKNIDVACVEMLNFNNDYLQKESYYHQYFKSTRILNFSEEPTFAIFNPGMIFIKKHLALRYRFREDLKIGEDINYYYKTIIDSPFCGVISKEKYYHRIRSNSASASKRKTEDTKNIVNILIPDLFLHSKNQYGEIQQFIIDLGLNIVYHEVIKRLENIEKKDRILIIEEIKKVLNMIYYKDIINCKFIDECAKKIFISIRETENRNLKENIIFPLISVVLLLNNKTNKKIRKTINSVIAQDYSNLELLIVDYGSRKNNFIRKYLNWYGNQIKYYRINCKNYYEAVNFGIRKSSGEYITFINNGDKYRYDKLSKEFAEISQNKNKCIVFSDYAVIDFKGNLLSNFRISKKQGDSLDLIINNNLNLTTFLFPKKIFDKSNLFNNKYHFNVLEFKLLELIKHFKLVYIRQTLTYTKANNLNHKFLYLKSKEDSDYFTKIIEFIKCNYSNKKEILCGKVCSLKELVLKENYVNILNNIDKEFSNLFHELLNNLNKKISIILPFSNEIDKVIFKIQEINKQSYNNYELLLINMNSTDSLEKITSYIKNDKKMRLFNILSKNINEARNVGIQQSKGDFISFLDINDNLEYTRYENQIKKTLYNNALFSHSLFKYKLPSNNKIIKPEVDRNLKYENILNLSTINLSTILVDRNLLMKKNIKFDIDKAYLGEILFYFEIMKFTDFLVVYQYDITVNIIDTKNENKLFEEYNKILIRILSDNYHNSNDYEVYTLALKYLENYKRFFPVTLESKKIKQLVNLNETLYTIKMKLKKTFPRTWAFLSKIKKYILKKIYN